MLSTNAALLCAVFAGLAPLVTAHGYVTQIKSGGKLTDTFLPFSDPYLDPVPLKPTRHFRDDGPVTDVKSKAIRCGTNANAPVKTVAKGFKAGQKVTFYWTKWPSDHRGPVMTYLANCNGDCTKFDGSGKVWFKIDHQGFAKGKWATDKLIAANNSWTVTIPSTIAAGQYLIRHEILALHSASAPNGAQFYPSCNQISITSSGRAKPAGVALPGAYSAKDPGVLVDIWRDGFSSYKIPGPAVFSSSSAAASRSTSTSASRAKASSTDEGKDDGECAASKPKSTTRKSAKKVQKHKKKKHSHVAKSAKTKESHEHSHDGHRRHHHHGRDLTSFLVRD